MSIPYAEEPTTSPRAKTPVKIAIVVCCALVASMWIYYFVFARSRLESAAPEELSARAGHEDKARQ